jgi:response regulator NasT
LRPILEVAQARFDTDRALRDELKSAQSRLSERKTIERAKGLLMKQKAIGEDEAYRLMQKLAMDKNVRLFDVAEQIINVSTLWS